MCEVGHECIASFGCAYLLDMLFSAMGLWKTAQIFLCCCTEAGRVASISSLGQRCILKENKHCKLAPVNRCSLCAELTECRLFLVHPAKAALVLDMVTAPATLSPFAAGSCAPWLAP